MRTEEKTVEAESATISHITLMLTLSEENEPRSRTSKMSAKWEAALVEGSDGPDHSKQRASNSVEVLRILDKHRKRIRIR